MIPDHFPTKRIIDTLTMMIWKLRPFYVSRLLVNAGIHLVILGIPGAASHVIEQKYLKNDVKNIHALSPAESEDPSTF